MDLGISGKRALVLASSRGLGLGIATALAREGADVLLCGRSADKLAANCATINAEGKGKAQYVAADIADAAFRPLSLQRPSDCWVAWISSSTIQAGPFLAQRNRC